MPPDVTFLNAIATAQSFRRVVSSSLAPAMVESFVVVLAWPPAYTVSMCQPLLKSIVRNPGGTRSSFAARHNNVAGRDIAT